jgi:hypothetical protein
MDSLVGRYSVQGKMPICSMYGSLLGFESSETGGGLLAAFVHHVMPRWHWQPSLGTLTVSADCTETKKHL